MVSNQPMQVGDRLDTRMTYEDYLLLPNDGRHYQLLEGELEVNPAPSTVHQRISRNLVVELANHVRRTKQGVVFDAPVDVVLSNDIVLEPDIIFIARGRAEIITKRAIEGAPDLVVEILSPSTRRLDRVNKMRLYARYGVKECWLVDPEALTCETFALRDGEYVLKASLTDADTLTSELLDELEVSLSDVFAEDDL